MIPSTSSLTKRLITYSAPALLTVLLAACTTPPLAPPPPPPEPAPSVVLPISQLDRGVQIVLPDSVLFATGKAELNSDNSTAYLDRIAHLLTTKTDKSILIEGHTDNQGSTSFNQRLSEQRADSVATALIERGVPVERISKRGLSFSQPAAPNDVEAGRRLNRRTELIIIDETVDNITRGEPLNAFEDAAARVKTALENAKGVK